MTNELLSDQIRKLNIILGEKIPGLPPVLVAYCVGPELEAGAFKAKVISLEDVVGKDDRLEQMQKMGYDFVFDNKLVPVLVFMITEGWFLEKEDAVEGIPPSQHKNRKEGVLVMGTRYDGREFGVSREISRDKDGNMVPGRIVSEEYLGEGESAQTQNNLAIAFFTGVAEAVQEISQSQ